MEHWDIRICFACLPDRQGFRVSLFEIIMLIVLLSDIHANWEALRTAIEYIEGRKIEKIFVLGDTVGYGANPNECFEWALERASLYVTGNHEKACMDPVVKNGFTDWAREAIAWTEKVLSQRLKDRIGGLPYLKIERDFTLAHGSPDRPEEFRYLYRFDDARSSFRLLENSIGFVGHTHSPCCFAEKSCSAQYLYPGILTLDRKERYILNPGSVGQPRDADKRLSFGVFDSDKWTFEIVRLEYDAKKAAEKIRKANLPASLAERLL